MIDKNAWQSIYKIVIVETVIEDGDLGTHYDHPKYAIFDHENNLHGTYRDYSYAKKQARRKYKKLVRLMERKLLS